MAAGCWDASIHSLTHDSAAVQGAGTHGFSTSVVHSSAMMQWHHPLVYSSPLSPLTSRLAPPGSSHVSLEAVDLDLGAGEQRNCTPFLLNAGVNAQARFVSSITFFLEHALLQVVLESSSSSWYQTFSGWYQLIQSASTSPFTLLFFRRRRPASSVKPNPGWG